MRLFHISEDGYIEKFIPRRSKEIWEYKNYVWAIEEEKIQNYLLPRDCPRICLMSKDDFVLENYLVSDKKSYIIIPFYWKERLENSVLFRYEFDPINFKLIDSIAGYYVSEHVEVPINKKRLENCLEELELLNVGVISMEVGELEHLKKKVIERVEDFSIIRWSNIVKE